MAIAGLLTQLVMDGVLSHSRHKTESIKKEWGFLALAAISGVIALSFATAALYMGLSILYTAPVAALLTGLVAGCISLSCLWYAASAGRKKELADSGIRRELANAQITEALDGLLEDMEKPVKDNPGTAVLLATLAGFMTADRLH